MKSKAAFLISLLVLGGLVAYMWTDGFMAPLARIQMVSNITVPPDATDVIAEYVKGFQDSSFYLQFSIPAESFGKFVDPICDPETEALIAENNIYAIPRRTSWPEWFLTDPTTITVSNQCIVESSGVYVDVFVDQNDPVVYRVYMHGGSG